MRQGVGLLLVLAFLTASFLFLPATAKAESKTIIVPEDYDSIQEAINNASEGDTIYVKKGIYHENVVINKPLSLIGEDVDTTIIDGNPPEGYRVPINIKCDNVSVSGFKTQYGYAGIQVGGANYCIISGNMIANAQFGIRLSQSSYNNITGNVFESIGTGSAIRLIYSTQNLINGNNISSSTEGIQLVQSSHNNTVSENTIVNSTDHAIRLDHSDGNTIVGNNMTSSGHGISIYVSNNNTLNQNNFINNTIQISTNEWYAQQWGYGYSNNTINQNYWSDYNGTDNDGDGIGDTPYIIDENNQDNNPLVNVIPEFPSSIILAPVIVTTLLALFYLKRRRKGPGDRA